MYMVYGIGGCVVLMCSCLGDALGRSSQQDISASTSHVGGHSHGTQTTSLTNKATNKQSNKQTNKNARNGAIEIAQDRGVRPIVVLLIRMQVYPARYTT